MADPDCRRDSGNHAFRGLWIVGLALLVLLWLTISPAAAKGGTLRAVMVLAPQLSAKALLEELSTARWEQMRKQSAVALVSAAVPGPDTPESGYLTIGTGRRLQAATNAPPAADDGRGMLLRATSSRVSVTLAASPDQSAALQALGPMSGVRVIPSSDNAARFIGSGQGIDELLIVVLRPGMTLGAVLEEIEQFTRKLGGPDDLLILSSADPDTAPGGQFQHLAPALFWGRGWGGHSAISATTRTAGLISNTDLTPTLLEHFGLSIPRTVEGHVAEPAPGSIFELVALERHVRAVGRLTIPVLIGWGVFAFFAVAAGLLLARGAPSARTLAAARLTLAAAAAGPVGMLLAGIGLPGSEWQLVASVVLLTVATASIPLVGGNRIHPLRFVFSTLAALVVADLFSGGHLLKRCLLGDFVNTGVRFYGIGNEFEGLMLGATVLIPFIHADSAKSGGPSRSAYFLWPLVLLIVAAPGLGADFGGALSLGLAYAAGLWLPARRRFHLRQVVIAGLLLILLAVGVVALDLMRPEGARSHVGELAAQALSGDLARVGEVASRKLLMNLRMTATPYALAGLAAVAALGAICYHMLAFRLKTALAARPLLRAGSGAALLGAAAAFILNDSGIVAGALAAGCVLLTWLDAMLVDAGAVAAGAKETGLPA